MHQNGIAKTHKRSKVLLQDVLLVLRTAGRPLTSDEVAAQLNATTRVVSNRVRLATTSLLLERDRGGLLTMSPCRSLLEHWRAEGYWK